MKSNFAAVMERSSAVCNWRKSLRAVSFFLCTIRSDSLVGTCLALHSWLPGESVIMRFAAVIQIAILPSRPARTHVHASIWLGERIFYSGLKIF